MNKRPDRDDVFRARDRDDRALRREGHRFLRFLPSAPLVRQIQLTGRAVEPMLEGYAKRHGIAARSARRDWEQIISGTVSTIVADRMCVFLEIHPVQLWDEWSVV